MSSVTLSVEELIEQTPDRDNKESFKQMWSLLGELREKMEGRFDLELDPSTKDLGQYTSLDGSAMGQLQALRSDEMDWLIHSFIGTPGQSFTNMHLTAWLGPQTRVPHFGMALGTIPDMFVYLDYVPRVDVMADLDYLDTYIEPLNSAYMDFEADPEFSPFVSRTLYMRQAQTKASLCLRSQNLQQQTSLRFEKLLIP